MAQFDVTQSQIRVAKQPIQNKYVRIELLNNNFQVVDNLEGVCIGGSLAIDANSDMRRSGNLNLTVVDASFEVQSGSKIFLDRYIRVWVDTYSIVEQKNVSTNCGIYIIDAPSYVYDATTNTLNLSLLDLMAKLSGVRNGYLQGLPVKILAGENIRRAMIDTLALGGFTKYVIDEAPESGLVPTDIEFSQGVTVYEILSALRDIYPNNEIYFDVNGVFHYSAIPTGENEPIQIDDSLWETIVIAENTETDFQSIKNSIEVFGRTHDPEHYSTTTTVTNNVISLNIPDVTSYVDYVIYGFTLGANQSIENPTLNINQLGDYSLYDESGDLSLIETEDTEEYFCVKWDAFEQKWQWLGHLQAYAIAEDNNVDSPYYIGGSVGRIRLPLYGGDYDNIVTDNLAKQRAQYELWKRTQLQTTVTISCTTVEWLDVNSLVEYTLQRNKQTYKWIIKSINYGLDPSATMTVQLARFYPNYFYI